MTTEAGMAMITDRQIEQLSDESGEAGDLDMVAVCSRALGGDVDAYLECVRVIGACRAQALEA